MKQIAVLLPLLIILPKFMGVDGIMFATPVTDFISFIVAVVFLVYEFKKMPRD